jgi:hypothetical protein
MTHTDVSTAPETPRGDFQLLAAASTAGDVSALDRLAVSRGRLHEALMIIVHPRKRESLFASGVSNLGANLLLRVQDVSGLDFLLAGIEGWWHQSPARTAATAAAEAAQRLVVPVAGKRPIGSILVALGMGWLLALLRPWRLLLRPALVIGVLFQVAVQAAKRAPPTNLAGARRQDR